MSLPDAAISNSSSVALLVPDPQRRRALARLIAGLPRAVARDLGNDALRRDPSELARLGCDMAMVDMDADLDQAVRVIETICSHNPSTTVIACSAKKDLGL